MSSLIKQAVVIIKKLIYLEQQIFPGEQHTLTALKSLCLSVPQRSSPFPLGTANYPQWWHPPEERKHLMGNFHWTGFMPPEVD